MSGQQRLPLEVDPFRMADVGRRMAGQVELGKLKRLAPMLESTDGVVDVELAFDIDESGVRYLYGVLQGKLELSCQRCLARMDFPLQGEFRLALVHNDSEAERLSERYEPLVVETTPMHMLDMIEDEIILSIPHIPMHEEGLCSIQVPGGTEELAEQPEEDEEKPNPFAVLEKLKKDH